MTSIMFPTVTDPTGGTRINIDTTTRLTIPEGSFSCKDILSSLNSKDPSSFLNKYSITSLQNNLNLISGKVSASNIDGAARTPSLEDVSSYLDGVTNTDIPYVEYMCNCIEDQEKRVDLEEYTSTKESLQESKERLEFIKNPENYVSPYEGWFPLQRPMKDASLFVLFGIGLFVLLCSVALFLRTQGVQISITVPSIEMGYSPGIISGMYYLYTVTMRYLPIGLLIGVLLGYFIYLYRK